MKFLRLSCSWLLPVVFLSPLASKAELASCARIEDPAARLACYDDLARRESERRSQPAPLARAPAESARPASRPSALEERWALRDDLGHGTFGLVPHRPVYGLVHWTSDTNREPASPTRPFDPLAGIDLNRAEGKIQLSFKSKLVESMLDSPVDLWFGYTQVSYWQLGNRRHSSPFRETNYEPEATFVLPVDIALGGLRLRLLGLTVSHQSNGRSGSRSRSWNRLIGEAAAEYGSWSVHARPWTRILEPSIDRNDNPDIEDHVGRGELIVQWRGNGHVLSAAGRHSLRTSERSRGSLQFDWAFPLVGALNAHVQIFSGYGLNLIDYNHRQTTLSVGLSFFD